MYKANKPCKFGDRLYLVGETIPDELIAKGREKALVKYGTISFFEDTSQEAAEPAQKPVEAEGGNTHTATENDQKGGK